MQRRLHHVFVLLLMMAPALGNASAAAGDNYNGDDGNHNEPLLLIFETDTTAPGAAGREPSLAHFDFLRGQLAASGYDHAVVGQGAEFKGWSTKYSAILPALRAAATREPARLVVLSDSRDVLLNPGADATATAALFGKAFEELTRGAPPGAVVVSAEAQCCVSALAHAAPGAYFDVVTGARSGRACHSGQTGCQYPRTGGAGTAKRNMQGWKEFMGTLAEERGFGGRADIYLNAGLLAGRAADLLRLVDDLALQEDEDDQAVLTGLLHHAPDRLVLDYEQRLFGNNRWTRGDNTDGCVFDWEKGSTDGGRQALVHRETGTAPLLVHSPGKFFSCMHRLAGPLGFEGDVTGSEGTVLEGLRGTAMRRLLSEHYGIDDDSSGATTLPPVVPPAPTPPNQTSAVGGGAAPATGLALAAALICMVLGGGDGH